jgi:hypothetical protein
MSVTADGQEKETYLKDLQHTMLRMTGVGCDTAEMNRILLMIKEYRNTGTTIRGTEKTAADIPLQAKSMAMAVGNAVRSSVAADNLHNIPVTFHLYVSPEGNDNNAGTAAAPFRTIQKAVDTASERQADGVYAESVTVTKSIHIVGTVAKLHVWRSEICRTLAVAVRPENRAFLYHRKDKTVYGGKDDKRKDNLLKIRQLPLPLMGNHINRKKYSPPNQNPVWGFIS